MSPKMMGCGIAALVVFIVAAAIVVHVWTISDLLACDTDAKGTTPSPDGKRTVVMFAVNCGATVPFNTQLSISPIDRRFSRDDSPAFLILDGEHKLPVVWTGDRSIVIDLPKDARVFRSERRVNDVTIEYR